MKLKLFFSVAVTGIFLLLNGNCFAAPISFNITSNSSWKSSDEMTFGWETIGFDDSKWASARESYPNPESPTTLIFGTTAQYIWYDPTATSNGTTGSNEAFFRFAFDLDIQPDSLPLTGRSLVSVDDDYDLFVNGNIVFQNHDGGHAEVVDFVDFTSSLRDGENVIAIHAVDGRWNKVEDRVYERVLFDGAVRTVAPIPIPGALLLFAFGFASLRLIGLNRTSNYRF